ncbi:SMP-30/gluconolactonase/LRE family protein [Alteromonas gracilis]|uniref:SMP-30/gluconolactonase/LRE family protein n=1 Tax=Alteromonas gracilis TaxID=1479524 RepID=UPI0030CD55BB
MKIMLTVGLAMLGYLIFWPTSISPVAWQPDTNKGYTGPFEVNQRLANLEKLSMGKDLGPEDFAINSQGDIATSSHSGYILLQRKGDVGFARWVNTKGRPLGIEFDSQDNLIVADAVRGLLSISPDGNVSVLLDSVNGSPIVYADDVDISRDGTIYFTDATTKFSAQAYGGTLAASFLEIFEHQGHGRVYAYQPDVQHAELLLDGLVFANGVAVSHDGRFLLVNETGKYRILRCHLQGEAKGSCEEFVANLPGFPDNVSATKDGFLVGLASPRSHAADVLAPYPFVRGMIQRLPSFMRPSAKDYGHLMKLDTAGRVIENYQDPSGEFSFVTGAIEVEDGYYVSSLTATHVGFLPFPRAKSVKH